MQKLQIAAFRVFEIQKNFWDNVSCGDPFLQKHTLADSLCRIPALSTFVENVQEYLQVYLKRAPLQMLPIVAGKFPKKIGGTYENSKLFYKIFYADAETSTWPFF